MYAASEFVVDLNRWFFTSSRNFGGWLEPPEVPEELVEDVNSTWVQRAANPGGRSVVWDH